MKGQQLSVREAQAGLTASPDEASWVQSSYLIAEIVMIPLSGYLARAVSTRVMFSLSTAGFTVASLLRNLGGATGLAIINTVIQWRENFHWSRLGEQVNPGRPEVRSWLAGVEQHMADMGVANPAGAAMRQLLGVFQREVLVMSYIDCLALLTWIFVAAAVVPLFLRKPSGTQQAGADAH